MAKLESLANQMDMSLSNLQNLEEKDKKKKKFLKIVGEYEPWYFKQNQILLK